jgi:hypothetical protein
MSNTAENLIQKIRDLPPERIEEVDDFVDFLRSRQQEKLLVRAAEKLSESTFKQVWDNPEDADYDKL